ncbi:hypothetical protein SAMN06273570_3247 [Candidatus Pantoea floridensis]|uniref:Uncharacterized protein n=1 Tax=Candidatus Pantoea floridensis TaxID=1938870 RepID=A0A286BXE5_9GAMM|nr:hypothetical protein BX596_0694 [Enterobacteriaceae bacterium JKS000233]SOD38814.1 hypothetical protein SAMN06273570_3247 [Pantoea floridensis]
MSLIPRCGEVITGNVVSYYGDWGECSFNYGKQACIGEFISHLLCFILWLSFNQMYHSITPSFLGPVLSGIAFLGVFFSTMVICVLLNSVLSKAIVNLVRLRVLRQQSTSLKLNIQ